MFTKGVAGFQHSLGLGGELSAGLRFRGEASDSALMSTRTVAAAVWKCGSVRVERGVVRRLHTNESLLPEVWAKF